MITIIVLALSVLTVWTVCHVGFVLFSLLMCWRFSVFKMRGTSNYNNFSVLRYVWGFIRHPTTVPKLCTQLWNSTGYMSNRIAPNQERGWTYDDNVALSKQRASALRDIGESVLNPTSFNEFIGGTWSPFEYMVFWTAGVVLAALFGKKMFYFPEDILGGSRGCRKEQEIARQFGMPLIPVPALLNQHTQGSKA